MVGYLKPNPLYTNPGYTSSLSLCRAASMDISDPLLPLHPIVHRLCQAVRDTTRILTELLYVCSSGHMWGSIGVHHL